MPESPGKKVLVLGGYGLIGEAVVGRLVRDGHQVTGLGRDVRDARRRWPAVGWIAADMAQLLAAEDWLPMVAGMDVVRQCGGRPAGRPARPPRRHPPEFGGGAGRCLRTGRRQAASENAPLPIEEKRLFRIWFACGFPTFGAVLAILWLMVTRPEISF